jgi:hypothetical protein
MPVIGVTFSRGCSDGARGFVDLELFVGLAQRNRGRKTTYFDAVHGAGKPKGCADPASAGAHFSPSSLAYRTALFAE